MSHAASSPDDQSCAAVRSPETLSAAARASLERWFRRTARLVKKIARQSTSEPEDIHRLRVAIRHVEAALITFDGLVPDRKSRKLRQRLRRLRRMAGDVRDMDVLLERLTIHRKHPSSRAEDADLRLYRKRDQLDRALRSAARDAIRHDLKQRMRRTIRRIRWRGINDEPQLASAAAGLLQPIAESCQAAGAVDLTEIRHLHRFRRRIKRLRYTTEFLQKGLDSTACGSLRSRLSIVQQRTGEVCDHAAALRLLSVERDMPGADLGAIDPLIAREGAALTARQAEFVAWWTGAGRAELEQSISACLR